MKKVAWRRRIKQACESEGTYREFFDPVIDTLADILERRDDAKEQFKQTGGNTVVIHTNKGGILSYIRLSVVYTEWNSFIPLNYANF